MIDSVDGIYERCTHELEASPLPLRQQRHPLFGFSTMSFSSIGGYSPWWAGAGGLALVLFATSRLRSGPGVYTDKVRGPPR
jgi:hypothetical protein